METQKVFLELTFSEAQNELGDGVKLGKLRKFDYVWYNVSNGKINFLPTFEDYGKQKFINALNRRTAETIQIVPNQLFQRNGRTYLFDKNGRIILINYIFEENIFRKTVPYGFEKGEAFLVKLFDVRDPHESACPAWMMINDEDDIYIQNINPNEPPVNIPYRYLNWKNIDVNEVFRYENTFCTLEKVNNKLKITPSIFQIYM